MFEASYLKPLDLDRAAKSQHGPNATAIKKFDHIYGWRALVGSQEYGLDMDRAAQEQNGEGYQAVTVGIRGDGWRALRFSDLQYVYVPVMLVAADRIWETAVVSRALACYQSLLAHGKHWIWGQTGRAVQILPPLVFYGQLDAATWNGLSDLSTNTPSRYEFLDKAIAVYESGNGKKHAGLKVLLTVYTGLDKPYGAAAHKGGIYALMPPRATMYPFPACQEPTYELSDALYGLLHEAFGHTAGLGHSAEDYPTDPKAQLSIMQACRNFNQALLLEPEKDRLRQNAFFKA